MSPADLDVPLDEVEERRLLAYLSAGFIAGGMPAHEVQDEVRRCALGLGRPTAQIAATPTHVIVSLDSGAPCTIEAVEGGLRLDQLASVHAISAGLQTGRLSARDALLRLRAVRATPHRYDRAGTYVGGLCSAVGIALILQPVWRSLAFAALLSPVVMGLVRLSGRTSLLRTLLPSVAALVTAANAVPARATSTTPAPPTAQEQAPDQVPAQVTEHAEADGR